MKKVLLLGILIAASACSHQTRDVDNLQGEWRLEKVVTGKQSLNFYGKLPAYTMKFADDEKVNGKLACNVWNAQLIKSDKQIISVKNSRTTRMRCHEGEKDLLAFSKRFIPSLSKGVKYSFQKDKLVLTISDNEQWQFGQE